MQNSHDCEKHFRADIRVDVLVVGVGQGFLRTKNFVDEVSNYLLFIRALLLRIEFRTTIR